VLPADLQDEMTVAHKFLTVAEKCTPPRAATSPAMSTKIVPLAIVVFFSALGCGAGSGTEPSSSTSEQAVSADVASTLVGHFVLAAAGPGNDDNWINEINLHKNGTFDGNFGNSVSNLSGHFFLANGTYLIAQTSHAEALSLSYSLDGQSASIEYLLQVQANGVELRPTDSASEPWFSMDAAPAPIALTFAADGSLSAAGALHAGDTALVRYEGSRSKCTGKGAAVTLLGDIDFPQPQFVDAVNEVDGYFEFLVPVSKGTSLTLWFETANASGCSVRDPSSEETYELTIQ